MVFSSDWKELREREGETDGAGDANGGAAGTSPISRAGTAAATAEGCGVAMAAALLGGGDSDAAIAFARASCAAESRAALVSCSTSPNPASVHTHLPASVLGEVLLPALLPLEAAAVAPRRFLNASVSTYGFFDSTEAAKGLLALLLAELELDLRDSIDVR
jgi:hypothetical protein